jgi:RNA recognition motif-containing protein
VYAFVAHQSGGLQGYVKEKNKMSSRLFVGNLDFSAQDQDLTELFGPFGSVVSAKVLMDRDTGRPRGFGFVEFHNSADASKAIVALDGQDFRGRNLRVNEAQARGTDSRGGGRPAAAPRRTDRW